MRHTIHFVFSAILIIAATSLSAQSLKHLDWSDLYKTAKVTQLQVDMVKYTNNQAEDYCLKEVIHFDHRGRVTHVQNYFACGKLFSEECFFYDQRGKLEKMTFSGRECRWDTLQYSIKLDDKERIIERSMVDKVSGQATRDLYTYGKEGDIIKWQKQRKFADNWRDAESKVFLDYIADRKKRSKNSVSHVYNNSGLLLTESSVEQDGKVDRSLIYTYTKK